MQIQHLPQRHPIVRSLQAYGSSTPNFEPHATRRSRAVMYVALRRVSGLLLIPMYVLTTSTHIT